MFRLIGGAVVYGLALYGAVKLLDRPKLEVLIQPGDKQHDERNAAAVVSAGQNDNPSVDQASEASTPSGPAGSL